MTETREDTIAHAVVLIDEQLGGLHSRNLVSSAEVTDLLLDLRTLLTNEDELPAPVAAGIVN